MNEVKRVSKVDRNVPKSLPKKAVSKDVMADANSWSGKSGWATKAEKIACFIIYLGMFSIDSCNHK
jgi:hypothetical protein